MNLQWQIEMVNKMISENPDVMVKDFIAVMTNVEKALKDRVNLLAVIDDIEKELKELKQK